MTISDAELKAILDAINSKPSSLWDTWQAGVAVVGGVITAAIALVQAWLGLREKRRELAWKKAESAARMMDEIFDFHPSAVACRIFDEEFADYQVADGKAVRLTLAKLLNALAKADDHSEESVHARRCFDALAYYFMRLRHAQRIGLIELAHVDAPMGYYVGKIATHRDVVERYLKQIGYSDTIEFMEQFSVWSPASETATQPATSP